MTPYYINEARFLIPGTWKDQLLTLFSSPADAPAEFSLVISREAVPPDTVSSFYAQRQLDQLPGGLPGFEMLRESSTQLDNLPAMEAEFFWQSDKGRMHPVAGLYCPRWGCTDTNRNGSRRRFCPASARCTASLGHVQV